MRHKGIQIVVVLLTLILMGELMRFPQASLTEDLRERDFIQEPIDSEMQLKLGQTGAAVVLGGLRSLVASFTNLAAFGEFEKRDWVELERLYEIIVTLQPRNTYYWESGAWHLGYNAYHDYQHKLGMAPPLRRQKQREYLMKSENFLLRGVEENPENGKLWLELGRLFSSPHKPYDFKKATSYFEKVATLPHAKPYEKREYFYSLGRTPGREKDALALGKELLANPNNLRYSSLRSQTFALQLIVDPEQAYNEALIEDMWPEGKKRAYIEIVNYWCRGEMEGFPRGNLGIVINRLQKELNILDKWNPVKNKELRRISQQF